MKAANDIIYISLITVSNHQQQHLDTQLYIENEIVLPLVASRCSDMCARI